MAYAFVHDVPATPEMYAEIRKLLPTDAPAGLVAHLAFERDGGLRYVDVWETQADWQRFHEGHVQPAVDEVLAGYGIQADHSQVPLHEPALVDVWLGGAPAPAVR
ncbi:MAG TPA: hypothetical protein VF743_10195 [Acidimicrobiales bacterium]